MISLILSNWKLVLIAALLALLGVQQVRVDHAKSETAQARQEFADAKTVAAQAAQKAEADARTEETRREAEKEKVISDAHAQTAVAQAAAADAARSADGLRVRLAQYVAAVRQATSDPAAAGRSTGQPGADPLDLLSQLYSRSDDAAGAIARYADAAVIAGTACERIADGLQPPTAGSASPPH